MQLAHSPSHRPTKQPAHRLPALLHVISSFIKQNTVLCIAILAAAVTSLIVPPDAQYLSYLDGKTLCCLFSTLAVVCALKNIHFFQILARRIVRIAGNTRSALVLLIVITFVGSMLIANDMALLTFLPLGFLVLTSTDKRKYMAVTFILQNIAANLGGMLTPFGNPQNLYLYSKFNIPTMEFMGIMAAPFALSILLITVCCFLFVKPEPLQLDDEEIKLPPVRTVIYLLLFAFSIIIVFRVIPYWTGLIVIPIALLIMDRKALKQVDYPLLFTFVFFFIFSGNMARIGVVRELFSSLLEKNALLVSVLSCQVISNVPSAILLSQFTGDYRSLLLGVNIGGVGTLISSLASLITFREYVKHNPGKAGKYVAQFSAFNFAFLLILTGFALLF